MDGLPQTTMISYKRILIATDGSDNAKKAAIQGLALARTMGADVTVMSIIDEGPMTYLAQGSKMAPLYSFLESKADEAIDHVRQEAIRMNMVIDSVIKKGIPANEIINGSKDQDLVVMGTMGRTGLSHLLMGSVAEKVVRHAFCSVMIIG